MKRVSVSFRILISSGGRSVQTTNTLDAMLLNGTPGALSLFSPLKKL